MLTGTEVAQVYSVLRGDFQKGITEASPISSPLYEKVPSTGESNLYSWFDSLPGFRRWYDGQPRAKRNLNRQNFRVPNLKFEDTIAIAEDKVKDDQLAQFRPAVKAMARVGSLLEDQLVFDLLNYGFTGTTADGDDVKAYDAATWFADSHTVGVTVIDNKSTGVLSESTFSTALTTMMGWKAQADKQAPARPLADAFKFVLVVPPVLLGTAKDIVEVPLTTAGMSNKWYKAAEVMVSPYLTSSTAWFLLNVGCSIKPIFFQDREPLSMEEKTPATDTDAFMYDQIIIGAKRRCNACVTFPWLAYGSTGGG